MTDAPPPAIRRASATDVPAIRDLVHAAYARWVDVMGQLPRPMRADYDRAVVEHAIDLMTVDGVLVGLIETTPVSDGLLVINVAVAPDQQGHGYGRRLLDHAERIATTLGLGSIKLYTNKLMAANIALYGRLGYTIEREEVTEDVGTILHMQKAM